jgi:hypothetical protein
MTTKTPIEQARETRERYHANAETLTFTSGEHGTTSTGEKWTSAPSYGASIYTNDAGAVVATVGYTWKPTRYDGWVLIDQYRKRFETRDDARLWCAMMATAHGAPYQTERPACDLFTV